MFQHAPGRGRHLGDVKRYSAVRMAAEAFGQSASDSCFRRAARVRRTGFFLDLFALAGCAVHAAVPATTTASDHAASSALAPVPSAVVAAPMPASTPAMPRNDTRTRTPDRNPDHEMANWDGTTVFNMPIGTSPALGSPRAPVTIIEFGDFEDYTCARVEGTLKALRSKYGDKIRLVWRNLAQPAHPATAELAAEAAMEARTEAGDRGFWKAHDALLADHSVNTGLQTDEDTIVKAAARSGAEAQRIRHAIATHAHKKVIDADADLADDFNVAGMPEFFINGRRLRGGVQQWMFDKVIDEEIQKAQKILGSSQGAVDIYAALTQDGRTPLPLETMDLPPTLPADDPSRGDPGAKVVLHEWGNFGSPFCKIVEPIVPLIMQDYGRQVRLVWHDLPLPFVNPDARLAAEAGREALAQQGASAFWAIHDKLLDYHYMTRHDLDGYAAELHLDVARWNAALDRSTHAREIDASANAAAEAGIDAAPTFLAVPAGSTRGYLVPYGTTYRGIRKAVERALSEAK